MKNITFFSVAFFVTCLNGQVFMEDFESTSASSGNFPNGWTSSNNEWTINDPTTGTPGSGGATSIVEPAGTNPNSGNCTNVYAIVDSDGLGQGNSQNTDLTSPIIDLSAYSAVVLSFNHSFRVYGSPVADIEYSIDSGQTWSLFYSYPNASSYGLQLHDISALAGNANVQIRFHYEGNYDWWWAIDDIKIEQAKGVDMQMTSLSIPSFDGAGSTDITGVVTNLGVDTVNSFDVVWNDGSGPQSATFNVPLGFNQSYSFTHTTPIQTTAIQSYNISVEVSAQNDADSTNNILTHILETGTFRPFKKVLFEDQTIGANGFGFWSPRGIVRMEEIMLSNSSDSVEIISIHGNAGTGTADAMFYAMYQDSCFNNSFVTANAWPQSLIDRKAVKNVPNGVGASLAQFDEFKDDFGIADIDVYPTYDATARSLSVKTDLKFALNMNQLNLALVITEDSVHDDNDMGYSQQNAYNGGLNGPMASSSINFTTAGNPVPPSLMYFRNVARKILPSFSGTRAALPANMQADSTYSYTFPSYIVPPSYDPSQLRAIVLLIDPSNGFVYNTNGADVNGPSNIGHWEESLDINFDVYPNPSSDRVFVRIDLSSSATLTLLDLKGQTVLEQQLDPSPLTNIHELHRSELAKGVYLLRLRTSEGLATRKIVLE